MKKARTWAFLTGLVSLLILILLFSASALAAGPTELYVNDVNILAAPGNKVQCGKGTATYDEPSQTLTLNNAEITEGESGIDSYKGDLIIALVGDSTIGGNVLYEGIFSLDGTVTITGPGTLRIATKARCIFGDEVVVDGATLQLEPLEDYAEGIYTLESGNVTLQNRANVTIVSMGSQQGIFAAGDVRVTQGSTLTLEGSFAHMHGIVGAQNLEIDGSTVNAKLESWNAGAVLCAMERVSITNSHVTLQSNGIRPPILGAEVTVGSSTVDIAAENAGGIWADDGKLTIADQSKVTMEGTTARAVISAETDIDIQNSTVTAISQDVGATLWSGGNTSVLDGGILKVTSNGTNELAILVHSVLTVAENSEVIADGGISLSAGGVTVRPALGGHMRVHATRHEGGAAELDHFYGTEQNVFNNGELNDYFHLHIQQYAHTPGQDWERSDADHWRVCTACGTRVDEQPHTPGAWGWDDNAHWHACALCGARMGEQSHAFPQTWTPGETSHWHACACGARQGEEDHIPGEAWEYGDASHWHVCTVCDGKANVQPHTYEWVTDKEPGSGVPGSKHEQCTACGRAKPPLPIPALPQTGDTAPIALWLVLLLASGVAIAAVLVVRKRRKQ